MVIAEGHLAIILRTTRDNPTTILVIDKLRSVQNRFMRWSRFTWKQTWIGMIRLEIILSESDQNWLFFFCGSQTGQKGIPKENCQNVLSTDSNIGRQLCKQSAPLDGQVAYHPDPVSIPQNGDNHVYLTEFLQGITKIIHQGPGLRVKEERKFGRKEGRRKESRKEWEGRKKKERKKEERNGGKLIHLSVQYIFT